MRDFRWGMLAAVIGLAACGGQGAESRGESLFKALDRGEIEQAMALFGEAAAQGPMAALLQLKLKGYADKIDDRGGLQAVKCSAPPEALAAVEKAGRGRLTLSCKLDFGDGSSDTDKAVMRLRDGRWFLDVQ